MNVNKLNKTLKIKIMRTLNQIGSNIGKKRQIMYYKDNITILEFIKEFQQDIIAELEYLSGIDLARKSLPKELVDEINKKKAFLRKNSLENTFHYIK